MLTAFKTKFKALLLSKVSPKEVSEAFALGVFISLTPTLGLHTWLALGLAALLKKNKLATLLGAYLTNPLTAIPVFYFNFRLGEWMLSYEEPAAFTKDVLLNPFSLGEKVLVPLWAGSLVVALVGSVVAYYLTLFLYRAFAVKLAEYRRRHGTHHDPS